MAYVDKRTYGLPDGKQLRPPIVTRNFKRVTGALAAFKGYGKGWDQKGN